MSTTRMKASEHASGSHFRIESGGPMEQSISLLEDTTMPLVDESMRCIYENNE